jgi:hypothetical protein
MSGADGMGSSLVKGELADQKGGAFGAAEGNFMVFVYIGQPSNLRHEP